MLNETNADRIHMQSIDPVLNPVGNWFRQALRVFSDPPSAAKFSGIGTKCDRVYVNIGQEERQTSCCVHENQT